MGRSRFPAALALFLAFVVSVSGQNAVCVNQSLVQLDNTLPYFRARFPGLDAVAPTRRPWLGGRNETYCCIQAINEFLRNNCTNTTDVHVDSRILDPSAQFPCGAAWNGDPAGAPPVEVSYAWAGEYCGGWGLSQASNLNQWAQLLVAFILPSVVFSFNIPRPAKLRVSDKFFPHDFKTHQVFSKALSGLGGAVGAAVVVSADTIMWLMFSFAFAAPLLLSGLYEAQLDKNVLHFLQEHIKHHKLPLALRARILFTILCGNLDMYPAWSDTMDLAKHLDGLDRSSPELSHRQSKPPEIQLPASSTGSGRVASPMYQTRPLFHSRSPSGVLESDRLSSTSQDGHAGKAEDMILFNPHEQEDSTALLQVRSQDFGRSPDIPADKPYLRRVRSSSTAADGDSSSLVHQDSYAEGDSFHERSKTIDKVTVRLRGMLSCQYSFGSTIGGPVVFYLGAFIYTMLDLNSNVGDENIGEALAFGMWWTIIPHVAAVAGLLLAGNNPNILEGIVSIRDYRYAVGEEAVGTPLSRCGTVEQEDLIRPSRTHAGHHRYPPFVEDVYEAKYHPAWMWDRGKNKQDWLLVLFTDSWLKYQRDGHLHPNLRDSLENFLCDAIMLTFGDWFSLWCFAFCLFFIPFLFAFLTAFYTPKVGIGCRAMTLLIYTASQVLLLLLWTYYLTGRDNYWTTAREVKYLLKERRTQETERQLHGLIGELKKQAKRDTNMSTHEARRSEERVRMVSDASDLGTVKTRDRAHPSIKIGFYVLCTIGFVIALLSSIGGTMMQLIGIYRCNICLMNAPDWIKSDKPLLMISTNTSQEILEAHNDWLVIGGFSAGFLGVTCYIGWFYQKRLRIVFKEIAGQLDWRQGEMQPLYNSH